MAKTRLAFDDLLAIDKRDTLLAEVARWPVALTLPQARQLADHARGLSPARQPLRLAVVHTYTSDLLEPWLAMWASLSGFDLAAWHAPYGLALQEAEPGSNLVQHRPDITLMMLRREDLHPEIAQPIAGLPEERREDLRRACQERIADIVGRFRAQPVGQIVLTLLPSTTPASLGLFDTQSERSEAAWWTGLQQDVAAWIRAACPATLLLDLADVQAQVGRANFFDRRYWHSAQFPFTAAAAHEFARRVLAVGTVLKAPKAKVIVLDADNTLWGGVIGEDGMDGIALGPDYPGSAYREFQRRILDFQQRGFILAMCSKNNVADVDEVLQKHPHMILREHHFAARRVNWLPKPDNLVALAEELNLGLESFVFVDDSDHECAAVRDRLPQVQVVQVPQRPVDVATCLDHVARLEVLSLTREDLDKTRMYAQERQRRDILEHAAASSDANNYLARLGMKMRITLAPATHVPRLAQLTQKTNQFNLTTRRYDEQQMRAFIDDSNNWLVADFSLADSFGDAGIVGLAMFRLTSTSTAELDNFLMSCRVIGRQAESAFLHSLLRQLAERGIEEVVADYVPTAKNPLVKDLLPREGFISGADGRFHRRLTEQPARPAYDFPIDVEIGTTAPIAA
ncbi:MAG: HAD-IIIC family phosphatase [Burkholderiales bacterium]|nr:HAD-IIIC family phosphatase [Burkholderiales bacterium]